MSNRILNITLETQHKGDRKQRKIKLQKEKDSYITQICFGIFHLDICFFILILSENL